MKIGIIGAGVGGLSSAYFLKEKFKDVRVYEAGDSIGGLARSFQWHGFDCDIGPHRLYTDDPDVLEELKRLVPLRRVRRKSHIFLQGKWIGDPVNAVELLWRFFPWKSLKMGLSYVFRKNYAPDNFENVVLSRFGVQLNELFFKPYSEKLMGIPANTISAGWAKRKLRVGGLRDFIQKNNRLYFSHFYYPESGGYGAICNGIHKHVSDLVRLGATLKGITALPGMQGYRCEFLSGGEMLTEEFDLLLTTLPLPLVGKMLGADIKLRMRPTRFVYLLLGKPHASESQWLYFADKEFIINRVSEFRNFSGSSLPDGKTVLCCEVTQLERYSEARLLEELEIAGMLRKSDVLDIREIDVGNAYPVYDLQYDAEIANAKAFFADHPRLFHIGRNADFTHKDADEIFADAKALAKTICARFEG